MAALGASSVEEVRSETTPLLPPAAQEHDNYDDVAEQMKAKAHARKVFLLVATTLLLADFGSFLSLAPTIQILEQIVCDRHRATGSSPLPPGGEPDISCKSDAAQSELALVIGWMFFSAQLPGIVLALPYGLAADRFGRKPIMILSLLGLILQEIATRIICAYSDTIPVEAIWFVPIFQTIGGGAQVATSMAYTMLSDVYGPAERTRAFLRMAATLLIGETLATPISALAMSWSVWVPFMIGLGIEILCLLISCVIPETCKAPSRIASTGVEEQSDLRASEDDAKPWLHRFKQSLYHIGRDRQNIVIIVNVLLVAGALLMASIGREILQIIIQYASKKFSWTVAESSLLLTIKGAITLVILLLILPQVSSLVMKYRSAAKTNFLIVVGSLCFLSVGSAFMGFAQKPAVFILGISCFSLGWGFYAALRSLGTSLVPPSHMGAVNTVIAMTQSIGSTVSGPILAYTLRRGIAIGGTWIGLPFMVAALIFIGVGALVFCIRLPRQEQVEEVEEEAEYRD